MNRTWYSKAAGKNSPDAVHQILAFGTLEDIRSLKKTVGEEKVKKLFIGYPKKVYTERSLNFIKNFILRIKSPLDEQKYIKYTPRHIG